MARLGRLDVSSTGRYHHEWAKLRFKSPAEKAVVLRFCQYRSDIRDVMHVLPRPGNLASRQELIKLGERFTHRQV
jgi:hypothetical protein